MSHIGGLLLFHSHNACPDPFCRALTESGLFVFPLRLPPPGSSSVVWKHFLHAARRCRARMLDKSPVLFLLGLQEGVFPALILASESMPDGLICIPPPAVFPPFPYFRLSPPFHPLPGIASSVPRSVRRMARTGLYAVTAPLLIACRDEALPRARRLLSAVSSREHSLFPVADTAPFLPDSSDYQPLLHQILSFLR